MTNLVNMHFHVCSSKIFAHYKINRVELGYASCCSAPACTTRSLFSSDDDCAWSFIEIITFSCENHPTLAGRRALWIESAPWVFPTGKKIVDCWWLVSAFFSMQTIKANQKHSKQYAFHCILARLIILDSIYPCKGMRSHVVELFSSDFVS